ncbi:MAG: hypothetical protein WAN66_06265 [Limnoraphis robusta]|uniref:Uncharacterized protein n=2 Tax=Limnoraphis robusta TaxID=1118279 RepID=A0A0F5YHR0_9CYAN|nr:hypothetical protein [Limnoraphis robusta]KKD38444.1 hypothetical protein WN50_08770 [Limnoraphis robusta CS-951]MEA5519343.1 hypothetical protein [Limnoraphis robusta CCNP1315]MEA5545601.1 hypothetical protein [Limnoraphis robusta CCNP1324]
MVSNKLLQLEQFIDELSLEDKLWLLDKIFEQVRGITDNKNVSNDRQNIEYDDTAKPIWEIVVEIGAKIPESEWEKVPSDLSKNFDLYQGLGE